jgi:excinuclease ABC subunit C
VFHNASYGGIFVDKRIAELRDKCKTLPMSPGVYIMKELSGKVIYIGKAKFLKDRVSSYFGSDRNQQNKVKKMVSHIQDFSYILTDSEFEALVLECSLIKQYQPKYNIMLKDDKGYNYIKITNEPWPRIFQAKHVFEDGATYLGPYTSSHIVKQSIDEVCKIFKFPRCNKQFFGKSTLKGHLKSAQNRPCLNYHINQCSAPCSGKISREAYLESLSEAINFLKGDKASSIKELANKMKQCAENLDFERAAGFRDKIRAIERIKERQKVVATKFKDQDIIALARQEDMTCFEVFRFSDSNFCDRETFFFNHVEEINIARSEFIQQYYLLKKDIPAQISVDGDVESVEILCEWLSNKAGKKIKVKVPQRGEEVKIVRMCQNNAQESLVQRFSQLNKNNINLKSLQDLLNLDKIPNYIEAYDISNLRAENNVGGMVVFENGEPLRSAYKKFKINSIANQNDYGSMCEMIDRRFNEYEKQEENAGFGKLPDLILLDGGRGHVRIVKSLLKFRGYGSIPVYGMVKDIKHKTNAMATDAKKIPIKSNRIFNFISLMQNEVHRFAIGYHRSMRKKKISSVLLSIPGVGQRRAKFLLEFFKSVDNIKNAAPYELKLAPGLTKSVAQAVYNHFHLEKKL